MIILEVMTKRFDRVWWKTYERNVLECQLSSDVGAESEYPTIKRRLPQGSHRI